MAITKFYVADKLGADVILRCDYWDNHVECIRPKRLLIKRDNGSTIPIIREAVTLGKTKVPIPEVQVYAKQIIPPNDRIFANNTTRLETKIQTWIKVKIAQIGEIIVEPLPCLHDRYNDLVFADIFQAPPGNNSASSFQTSVLSSFIYREPKFFIYGKAKLWQMQQNTPSPSWKEQLTMAKVLVLRKQKRFTTT